MSIEFRPGSLYLIPTPLGKNQRNTSIPEFTIATTHKITHFAVESVQNAASFLQWINHPIPDFKLTFYPLTKQTSEIKLQEYINLLLNGDDLGVLTDAGCPGVADPGSDLVRLAHSAGIPVKPLTGPSSPLLALMGMGLGGQHFAFNGYLPVKPTDRKNRLLELEKRSADTGMTELFMEAPHRNADTLRNCTETLANETLFGIAANLTTAGELLIMHPISDWKRMVKPEIEKIPAIFGLKAHQKPKPNLKRKAVKKKFGK
ncbi:MAG: SAM-dependent methyltransferase [Balneolales bacterium]|nr:SAM-dependent methyltransferase [Balneolales bacterium]